MYAYAGSIYPSMMHPRLQRHFGPQWRPNPCNHHFGGWNEALSHALDGLERQTTGQKCSTHRALSRRVLSFGLARVKTFAQDCPSLLRPPGRFAPNLPPAKSATAAHEGKPRAASNPAQWLPLSKAVPARRFFRGGARKTPDRRALIFQPCGANFSPRRGSCLAGGKGGGGRG